MPGIRIRPKPDRNVPDNSMVAVTDKSQPLQLVNKYGQKLEDVKDPCKVCGVLHTHKVYHFQLEAGSVIISPGVWERLQRLVNDGGFEMMNTVVDPPTQRLGVGHADPKKNTIELVQKWSPEIKVGD